MSELPDLSSISLTEAQLSAVRTLVAEGPNDAHYPLPEHRLHAGMPGVTVDHEQRRLVLPYEINGRKAPWHVQHHPNRTRALANPRLASLLDPEIISSEQSPLAPAVSKHYADQGYWLDQHGNPVPYAAVQMLEDPDIGVVTGLGAAWHKGINQSSDLLLAVRPGKHDPWVFPVVERKDATNHDGRIAFPGGHNDKGEAGAFAARRETSEEIGVPLAILGDPKAYERLGAGLLVGAGATAHAMSGNEIFFHTLEGSAAATLLGMRLKVSSESYQASWKTITELSEAKDSGRFFPHHFGHLALVEARLSNI